MVSINDLNDAYKRINPYIVKTPIHISDTLNKKFDSNIFLKDERKSGLTIAGATVRNEVSTTLRENIGFPDRPNVDNACFEFII